MIGQNFQKVLRKFNFEPFCYFINFAINYIFLIEGPNSFFVFISGVDKFKKQIEISTKNFEELIKKVFKEINFMK